MSKPRVVFVDLLRLVATFQMVQGHTIDAVLDRDARHGALFDGWTFCRGLTAVAFLFAMGAAFAITTPVPSLTVPPSQRDGDGGRAALKRLRRAGVLIALGYLLHLPIGALFGDPNALPLFFAIDVLQCIGVSLALLVLLYAMLRSRTQIAIVCAILAALCFVFGSTLANAELPGPVLLTNWVSARHGSIFPLAPWMGFALAGVAAANVALPEGSQTPRLVTALRLVLLSVPLIAVGLLAPSASSSSGPPDPAHCALRLGIVIALCALIAAASAKVERLPTWAETLAGETLFVYAFHVLALYGSGLSIGALIGPRLAPIAAIGCAAAMLAISIGLALVYARKLRPLVLARRGPPS